MFRFSHFSLLRMLSVFPQSLVHKRWSKIYINYSILYIKRYQQNCKSVQIPLDKAIIDGKNVLYAYTVVELVQL